MPRITCNETKWDWEVEYDKLKANSLEHLENLKKYLESVAPVPEKGWDNTKALRDIHSKIFDAAKEAQARDPQGWKAAMAADNSPESRYQRMLGK